MLFAICREGVQVNDHYGALTRLFPPRNLQCAQDHEVYVLFDEAPHTYRGHDVAYRREIHGPGLPRPLQSGVWDEIRQSPGPVVRVLICNAFGGGYGDVLVGSSIVETLFRQIESLGKTPQIDFLIHPYSFERERHFEIYKLNPYIHRLHFTAITLEQYKTYDYYGTSENFLKDPLFRQRNVYDYFLARLGLPADQFDGRLKVYPNPAVLDEVREVAAQWRAAAGGEPVLLLNFFATALRAVPQFKWGEFVTEFARDHRLAFNCDRDSAGRLKEFVAGLPPGVRARTIDMSDIIAKSFEHLIAVLHHAVDVVVTPDTSVVHLSAAIGKPCVCIFFSVDPFRVSRYYPNVVSYCRDEFRHSSFWGQSKITDPEKRKTPIEDDEEWQALWRAVDVRELRAPLLKARSRSPQVPNLPQPVYLPRGARPRIMVYSNAAVPTLADRNDFGRLLSTILPDGCQAEVVGCRPLEFRSLCRCDLLILGLGDYFHEPILRQPGLVRFIRAAKRRIGIFGTQYPESLPADIVEALIGSMHAWFAPNRRDLAVYGGGNARSAMLGEWQSVLVPVNPWEYDRELVVDEERLRAQPFEVNLSRIQGYRRIKCRTVHSLLCALGSAGEVCYQDPREYRGQFSGRGQAVLEDVLGRDAPENAYRSVPAGAFVDYKDLVRRNVDTLRQTVLELLG